MRLTSVVKNATLRVKTLLRTLQQQEGGGKKQRARGLWSALTLPLLLTLPSWALTGVERPSLGSLKRAEVIRVLNENTLVVQVVGEMEMRLVSLIGVDPLPPINPAWTSLTGETPLALYHSGQFLQEAINRQEIYLEEDPQIGSFEGVTPAYVWRGTHLVNQEQLFQGHGLLNEEATTLKYGDILAEAAQVAQKQGRGIWTFYGPQP
ncbi:MAG: hypothetical protein NW237_05045 [Cyanobacteriota bacterium]|nr:hypothetical protein [Cyanobacteriota bacterium]